MGPDQSPLRGVFSGKLPASLRVSNQTVAGLCHAIGETVETGQVTTVDPLKGLDSIAVHVEAAYNKAREYLLERRVIREHQELPQFAVELLFGLEAALVHALLQFFDVADVDQAGKDRNEPLNIHRIPVFNVNNPTLDATGSLEEQLPELKQLEEIWLNVLIPGDVQAEAEAVASLCNQLDSNERLEHLFMRFSSSGDVDLSERMLSKFFEHLEGSIVKKIRLVDPPSSLANRFSDRAKSVRTVCSVEQGGLINAYREMRYRAPDDGNYIILHPSQ